MPIPTTEYEAWFVEFSVPLVSNTAWADSIVMTLSARDDNYKSRGADGCLERETPSPFSSCITPNLVSTEFSKVSPRIGLSWVINDQVSVRASRAESFRAPGFSDLFSTRQGAAPTDFLFDPLIDAYVPGIRVTGANSNLRPETAENISIGTTYTPNWAEGLVARLDYSKLDYIDRIANSFELNGLLPLEVYGNLPEFFVRDPNAVYPGTDINVLQQVIGLPINISNTLTEILDLDISHILDTDYGTFSPGINVSYVLDQFDVPVAGVAAVSRLGTTRSVDEYKAQARLDWNRGPSSASLRVNYTPSYDNINFVGSPREFDPMTNPDGIPVMKVSAYLTVDATYNYRWSNGFSARAGARNLFDKDFPFALATNGDAPYDALRVDLRGRVAFIEVGYTYD